MSTPDPDAAYWTTKDVAAYLGVKMPTVSAYRSRDQMPQPYDKIGRTWIWLPRDVIRWHESRPRPGVGGRPC